MKELSRAVQDFLNALPSEYPQLIDCHEVHVRSVEHRILVSCHCAMDGDLPITEVHDFTGRPRKSREGTVSRRSTG